MMARQTAEVISGLLPVMTHGLSTGATSIERSLLSYLVKEYGILMLIGIRHVGQAIPYWAFLWYETVSPSSVARLTARYISTPASSGRSGLSTN